MAEDTRDPGIPHERDLDARVAEIERYLAEAHPPAEPLPSGRVIHMNHRWAGTWWGAGLGVLTVLMWIFTFDPHGGVELSRYLAPGAYGLLRWMYGNAGVPVPVPVWYAVLFLHWPLVGALVDVLRSVLRRGRG